MTALRTLALGVCAAFVLLACAPALAQVGLPRVLGPTIAAQALEPARGGVAIGAPFVQPNFAAIEALARQPLDGDARRRFILDLLPGAEFVAEVVGSEVRISGVTVLARLVDVELGSAFLTYEAGVLVGAVSMPRASYAIDRQPDGRYRVARIVDRLLGSEEPPIAVASPARSEGTGAVGDIPADSGRLIDVMILWTPAAQTAAGGPAAIEAIAQGVVDQANLVYLNSGVAQRLRLVHREQVAYTERASGCTNPFTTQIGVGRIRCALYDVTGMADGRMDGIHALRNAHGADLVALLVARTDTTTGMAWMPLPPSAATSDQGFAVVAWDVAIPGKAFVHELGHTMGANHDPFATTGSSLYAYSHGFIDGDSEWRTVMALPDECVDLSVNCPLVDFLSTPNIDYVGTVYGALGTYWQNNNAHTLNKTAKIIASYRTNVHPIAQRFTDVASSHPFHGYIEFFGQAGVTTGCGNGAFCPDAPVSRNQMAVFIERIKRASNWTPPPAVGLFADVPASDPFAAWVEALYADGITGGCNASPRMFCPGTAVTRGQMAVFVLRASCGTDFVPGAPALQRFDDVPPSHAFYAFIDKFATLGITSGCGSGNFCPETPVTRGQMAVFIERAFPFLAPSDACTP